VAAVSAMLQFAVARGLLTANPAKGVKLYAIDKRERFLSEREVAALAEGMAMLEEWAMLNSTVANVMRNKWTGTAREANRNSGCFGRDAVIPAGL
jgi:hypothetical protein